jgi:dTDP-4-amino-4,6-dideoxygalactose transaminase
MDHIMSIARKHNLLVVEDAAQAVNSFYHGKALGSIGHLAAYSFHYTKNYTCGEGGAICINSPEMASRAETIRDKGTNRNKYIRGEVDKYTWVDEGSSYSPSELTSAFLLAQLEMMDEINRRRRQIYDFYFQLLKPLQEEGLLTLPTIPDGCVGNSHLFYILLPTQESRDASMHSLNSHEIGASFHYVPLHSSPMGRRFKQTTPDLPVTESLSSRLLRLPFFVELTQDEQVTVVDLVKKSLHP